MTRIFLTILILLSSFNLNFAQSASSDLDFTLSEIVNEIEGRTHSNIVYNDTLSKYAEPSTLCFPNTAISNHFGGNPHDPMHLRIWSMENNEKTFTNDVFIGYEGKKLFVKVIVTHDQGVDTVLLATNDSLIDLFNIPGTDYDRPTFETDILKSDYSNASYSFIYGVTEGNNFCEFPICEGNTAETSATSISPTIVIPMQTQTCYIAPPALDEACTLTDNFTATTDGQDVIVSTQNITDTGFSALIDQYGITDISIDFSVPGSVQSVTLFNGGTPMIQNWEEVLYGWGNEPEVSIQIIMSNANETYTCPAQFMPLYNDGPICDIFNLLKYRSDDGVNLIFDFNDPNSPTHFADGLSNLGMTLTEAQALFDAHIGQIQATLDYDYKDGSGLSAYTAVGRQVGDPIQDLSFTIATIDTIGLDGSLSIEYNIGDNLPKTCLYSPVQFGEEEIIIDDDLPNLDCNSNHEMPDLSNVTLLQELFPGEVVNIGGMYFKVTTATGSNGTFSGQGLMSIPFKKERLQVSFSGIQINEEHKVVSGTVEGIKGNPSDYPDFQINPDTINFGGEICIPNAEEPSDTTSLAPGEFDDRGFDSDGNHKNGTKWDDNGFDVNGKHKNGTQYNDDGCNYEGVDSLGNKCVQTTEDDLFISTYRDSVEKIIPTLSDSLLNNMLANLEAELNNLSCNLKKDSINSILSGLTNVDRQYIAGENDEYINDGLSNHFTSPPQVPVLQSNVRDPQIVELEKVHVRLYECDVRKIEIDDLKAKIEEKKLDGSFQNLIKRELQNLTKQQVTDFQKDEQAFFDYIINLLERILSGDIARTSLQKSNRYDYWDQPFDYYNSLTSVDDIFIDDAERLAEIGWMYEQGFEEIGGQHLGFYIEELHRQMMMVPPSAAEGVKLPLKISKEIGGKEYKIFIDNLGFRTDGAFLDAYFVFEDPNSGKRFVISAQELEFNSGGLVGESKLVLNTPVQLRLTNSAMLLLKPTNTYVTWDCNGFQSIDVSGSIEFCPEFIVPVDPATLQVIPDDKYELHFDVHVENWSEFYVELNGNNQSKPFAMPKHKDMVWQVSDFVIDISDAKSPENRLNYKYPSAYANIDETTGTSGLTLPWRGVYIGTVSVNLPKKLSGGSGDSSISISVSNLVIDGSGVSAYVSSDLNLLPLDKGNASGWPISIEGLELLVIKNKVAGGGFNGQIKVPVLEDPMDYIATLERGGKYNLSIKPFPGTTKMDLLLANVVLDSTSTLQMTYQEGEFDILATLNGKIDIKSDESKIDLPGLRFTEMEVGNRAPYLNPGTWQMENNVSFGFGGFTLGLSDLRSVKDEDAGLMGLGLNVKLTLAKDKITAGGGFDILGELQHDDLGRQEWKFKKVRVNRFLVDAKFEAGTIYGYIERFEDNPDYGKGFAGMLEAQFTGMPKISAKGLFGNKEIPDTEDSYKYFFVDALIADLPVPLNLGFLEINGFVGGLSYHMRQEAPEQIINPCTSSVPATFGSSLSGTTYIPDQEVGIGFKVGACFSTAKSPQAFNGLVSIEMAFNSSGSGLNYIALNGIGNVMADPSALGSQSASNDSTKVDTKTAPTEQALSAHVRITYNFQERELYGKLIAFLNIKNKMTGSMGGNKLVDAEIKANSDEWYIYIGTPTRPCGINMNMPGAGTLKLTTYLDIGTNVPNIPDIDPRVREIASTAATNPNFRNSGAGFVFGAKVEANMEVDAGAVAASLTGILGFDVMIKNFGDAKCVGEDGTLGVNGWYAVGQIYALLEGTLKFWGVDVLKAGIAAVLQAQMPNPFFAQATVGVKLKVLGVKRSKSFSVKLGNQCVIQSDDPLGMEIINSISPAANTKNVEVNSKILVQFNAPVEGGALELQTLSGTTSFESKIEQITLKSKLGYDIPYELEWSPDHYNLTIIPIGMFYSEDSISAKVEISVDDGNTKLYQQDSVSFTTGKALSHIPEGNINYAYPHNGMFNFHRREFHTRRGFITLKDGMPQLMYDVPDDMELMMRLDNGTNTHVFKLNYNAITRTIDFWLDPNILVPGTIHKLEVMYMRKGAYDKVGPSLDKGGSSGSTSPVTSLFGGPSHRSLYKMYFRVSDYDTFISKLDGIFGNTTKVEDKLVVDLNNEPITAGDLKRMTMTTDLSQERWHKDYVDFVSNEFWPIYIADLPDVPGFETLIDVKFVYEGLGYKSPSQGIKYIADNSISSIFPKEAGAVVSGSSFNNNDAQFVHYGVDGAKKNVLHIKSEIERVMKETNSLNIFILGPGLMGVNLMEVDDIKLSNQGYPMNITYSLPDGTQTTYYKRLINNQ